tara:strand:- start:902 stop:1192 length:291 start_codon:yes stop_codon:yes gene_type:complete
VSIRRFRIGDYIRWESGIEAFSASASGIVHPIEFRYDYGIVVDIAEGNPKENASDVIIAYCVEKRDWIVAHVDDAEYRMELVSRAPEKPIGKVDGR